MKYPAFYRISRPTPASRLVCCDACQQASWTYDNAAVVYCCNRRMRAATAPERNAGIAAIRSVLDAGTLRAVTSFDPSALPTPVAA